jgi:hypothetical protein
MPLTSKQIQLAERINTWVNNVGGDTEMLQGMADYMAAFKQIMDTTTSQEMDMLCTRYDGFYRFAKLLEDIAKGIQNGTIQVPK